MNVIEDVRRQLSSTTVTSAGPPTEEIIKHFGECWVRKDQIYLLLAAARAAAGWLRAKRKLSEYQEHGPLDIDTIYQLMTANRQAREAFWNAIAPLMEEVSDDNQA